MASGLLGSAEWDPWQGYEAKDGLAGNGLVFGCPLFPDSERWTKPNKANILAWPPNRHFFSVASTRSGKGVSLIIPNLLQYRGSCIVIDPKGENAWITAQYRRDELGQKVHILDPWGEVNRRYGDLAGQKETISRFNPLSILDPESPHYAEDIAYLADAIIINQGKEPHWDDSARELVAGLIAFTVEQHAQDENAPPPSLPLLRLLLTQPAEKISGLAETAQALGAESVAARKLGRFATYSREVGSIVSTALTQTAIFDSRTLEESLSHSDFSFDDLVTGRATIYLVLPVDKLQTYGRWLRLMVSIGIRTVARNVRPLDLPVLFMLDEFGTIGRLSAVAQAYGLMAGLQMCIWAFVQDLVQLRRDYPDDWETFIGNSEGVSFFNIMDQFTCEYLSRMLGTETVERISQATAEKRQGGFLKPSDPNYMAMADQVYARALKQPEEIRATMRHIGTYVSRSVPLRFAKIKYHEEPFFLVRSRPDPHFPDMFPRWKKLREERLAAMQKENIEKIKAQRQNAIPDFDAAKAMLEAHNFSVKVEGVLSKTITIKWGTDGTSHTFKSKNAMLEWTRENYPKPPVK